MSIQYRATFRGMHVPGSDKRLKMPDLPGEYNVVVRNPMGHWEALLIGCGLIVKRAKTPEQCKAKVDEQFRVRVGDWTEAKE